MRLHISMSADSGFKKNDRVVCKIAKDEWYTGTVIRGGTAKIKVEFDDGAYDAIIDASDFKHVKVLLKDKTITRSISDAEAKVLYQAPKKEKKAANVNGRSWAMSDIHACFDQFQKLLKKIKLSANDTLYLLGDYVDRGKDTKKLLDYLMAHPKNVEPFMGNHEDMMVQAYDDPQQNEQWWIGNGGDATLKSFGVKSITQIPKKYIDFLRGLKLNAQVGNFVLSHAGINMNHKNPFRDTKTNRVYMLWNRNVKPDANGKKRIIVGHTPKDLATIIQMAKTNKIMIDGGCAYGGNMVAYCLNDDSIVSVPGVKRG